MPGLDELGWLQFERLCELVLEADAGVDPTRWEGSADRRRERRLRGRVARSTAARSRRPCSSAACGSARTPIGLAAPQFKSVVMFANRPLSGDVVYGEEELLRGDPAAAGPAPEAAVDPLARRRAARPRRARALDVRHRGHARARAGVRPHRRLEPRGRRPQGAQLPRPHRPARDGQDRDRADARPRAAHRRAGRCTRCTRPEQVEQRFDRSGRSCSSPTTRSARPSTARTPPSAGRTTSTASCARPTSTTGSSGPRGPRRSAPACGACTASAAASTSRSRPPCRSTPPRSASRRRP